VEPGDGAGEGKGERRCVQYQEQAEAIDADLTGGAGNVLGTRCAVASVELRVGEGGKGMQLEPRRGLRRIPDGVGDAHLVRRRAYRAP
jgi:hypothetical protein